MSKLIIRNGTIVNEGIESLAHLIIEGDSISSITENLSDDDLLGAEIIDASGCFILPGVIDDQVHFREPGMTEKGDMEEGSRAAAAGGVTSFMEMPNVRPATTTIPLLLDKQARAAEVSAVNYAFYLGATSDNSSEIRCAADAGACGVKLFMGSSTGTLLVDNIKDLERLFAEVPVLMAAHCEDNSVINTNLEAMKRRYGEEIPVNCHPLIRSEEACFRSSSLAVSLARKYGTRLHILHISTERELSLFSNAPLNEKLITSEVCVHHLWFNDSDYDKKGSAIRWNPAIKKESDRLALVAALRNGIVDVVGSDHAPHLWKDKVGFYSKVAGGAPMVQHTLPVMLELVERGELNMTEVVDKMSHAPARLFQIEKRGFIRPSYKADLVVVKREEWEVTRESLFYKCGWSPLEGDSLHYKVLTTIVNGKRVYDKGGLVELHAGEPLRFQW